MNGLVGTGKHAGHNGPVFADPSGKRHRVLRRAGLSAAALLVAAFAGAVIMAMSGGPQAPFTQWAVPQAPASSQPPARVAFDRGVRGGSARGSASASPARQAQASPRADPSPSPAARRSASAAPSGSTTAVPSNRAGKTPPGRVKSPNPHKPASAA